MSTHDYDPSIGRKAGLDGYGCALVSHNLYGSCFSQDRGVIRYMKDCMVRTARGWVISMDLVDRELERHERAAS